MQQPVALSAAVRVLSFFFIPYPQSPGMAMLNARQLVCVIYNVGAKRQLVNFAQ